MNNNNNKKTSKVQQESFVWNSTGQIANKEKENWKHLTCVS